MIWWRLMLKNAVQILRAQLLAVSAKCLPACQQTYIIESSRTWVKCCTNSVLVSRSAENFPFIFNIVSIETCSVLSSATRISFSFHRPCSHAPTWEETLYLWENKLHAYDVLTAYWFNESVDDPSADCLCDMFGQSTKLLARYPFILCCATLSIAFADLSGAARCSWLRWENQFHEYS